MSDIINSRITDLVPMNKLNVLASNYRAKSLKTGRKPQLLKLFIENGIKEATYHQVIGLLGGTEDLHDYLGKKVELKQDDFTELFKNTIQEILIRLPKMTNNEVIQLANVLTKLQTGPNTTQVNTQVNFDMDKLLAERLS